MKPASTLIALVVLLAPTTALAWNPLRAENPRVKEGNAQMAEQRYAEALQSYDQAAQELPDERGVQLNRGLALLAQDLSEPSKEAFTAAADPAAPADVRGAAYYNLGIAHARQGNMASGEEDFEQATAHFREAAKAFKQSLRSVPGNRDAAWNLEYALQRILEEEQKQEQQQEQQQNEDQQQDQDQDQQQDQDQGQQQEQDQGQQQDQQDQQQEQDQQQDQDQQQEQGQQENESESASQPPPVSRSEADRFLDALEQNEKSLPLERARQRSGRRRPPEKDW